MNVSGAVITPATVTVTAAQRPTSPGSVLATATAEGGTDGTTVTTGNSRGRVGDRVQRGHDRHWGDVRVRQRLRRARHPVVSAGHGRARVGVREVDPDQFGD